MLRPFPGWSKWRYGSFRQLLLAQGAVPIPAFIFWTALFPKKRPLPERIPRPARTVKKSCLRRGTAASATRLSTAPTAGRATRSSAACHTTAAARRWMPFPCAPTALGSTKTSATGAITPSRTAAPPAGPPSFCWTQQESLLPARTPTLS